MSFSIRLADLRDNTDGLDETARLHALFDEWWAHDMEEHPERATSTGWPGHGHRWTDLSLGAIDRRRSEVGEVLRTLETIDVDALNEDDRLSYELFRREHLVRQEGDRFPAELMPISKMGGLHLSVPRTFSLMPARTLGNLDDAIVRLHGLSVYVDQVIGLLEEGVAAGVTPPRMTVDDVPGQLEALTATEHGRSPLLAPFESAATAGLDAGEVDDLRGDAEEALTSAAIPALRRLQRFFTDTYLPQCRETIAWSDLPDGADWYEYSVRAYTTTDLTPAEIHAIGLEECARIRAAMEDVIASTGHTGTFDEFTERLRTDPQFFFTDPEALLAAYRDIAKRVDPGLPQLFGTLPRLPYGVCAVPDHEAAGTTTAYYVRGSVTAGRPGWFFANTYDLASRPTWEMEALTLHEAVPGHHLQIALAAELEGLPSFRALSYGPTAFVEGWGLYAESLGTELGFYTDPYSRFGQLTYEMWRAVRLVVDTGIHAFGWTRDRAIEFFRSHSSKPMHDITVEVDRYISWPAQALAYKIGERTFQRLRQESRDALGDQFDIRRFHEVVLGAGALPLDLLEARVHAWCGRPAAVG